MIMSCMTWLPIDVGEILNVHALCSVFLQINDENVTNASHEYAVRLIKKSGSAVSLKVLRIMAFGLINAATLQKPTPSGKTKEHAAKTKPIW